MMPIPLNARKAALNSLNRLDKTSLTLDQVLDDVFSKSPDSDPREKALLHTLVFGVLRHRSRLDWIIQYYSKAKLKKLHPMVMNILRLGLFQIMYLDRIPVSAAVNTSVEMAKKLDAPWIHRFVNAVLRNAARGYDQIPFPDMDADPVVGLATRMSFPPWLIGRWIVRFGPAETANLCDYLNTIPPVTVRTNTLKTDRTKLYEALTGTAHGIGYTPYAPDGISFSGPGVVIDRMETFQNGMFAVQDEAAQIVTHLLEPSPGDVVLDACAGRGGKTGHMAQLMKNRGVVIAADINEHKLSILKSEMKRLSVSIVSTQQADLLRPGGAEGLPMCDKVLVDAPCSGLGVIRRNPDTKWRIQADNILRFKQHQIRLLNNLAGRVKAGGAMVYAVCSTEPEENENVLKDFLSGNSAFIVDENWDSIIPSIRQLKTREGFLKTLPHIHHTDGFFSVRLKKMKK